MYRIMLTAPESTEFYLATEFDEKVKEALETHSWCQNVVAVFENPVYFSKGVELDDVDELLSSIKYRINHTELTKEKQEKYKNHLETLTRVLVKQKA